MSISYGACAGVASWSTPMSRRPRRQGDGSKMVGFGAASTTRCSSRCFLPGTRPSVSHAATIAPFANKMKRPVVAIMARAPSSEGKLRLIRDLGIADGAGLRLALLRDTVESVSALAVEKAVLYTPPDRGDEIRAVTPLQAHIQPQRGSTLGERMREGARDLLSSGFDAVVLIGSDLPTLPPAHINAALDILTRRDEVLVLGPAEDGG